MKLVLKFLWELQGKVKVATRGKRPVHEPLEEDKVLVLSSRLLSKRYEAH